MIKVCVEMLEGISPIKVAVQADSIYRAVGIVKGRYPGREARVVFPIDSEEFFQQRLNESSQPLHGPFTRV